MSLEPIGRPNNFAPALGRRQEAGQHLHRRGLAAAIVDEEAEDFAGRDAEIDVIDGDEIAEPPRQSFCSMAGTSSGVAIRSRTTTF